jgi:hypothetical protein
VPRFERKGVNNPYTPQLALRSIIQVGPLEFQQSEDRLRLNAPNAAVRLCITSLNCSASRCIETVIAVLVKGPI